MVRERKLDFVICIDGSSSMKEHLQTVKDTVINFYQEYVAFASQFRKITSIRIKFIIFREYGFDEDAMVETDFFELPKQQDLFENFFDSIDAHGGSDGAKNGLEALYYAMSSDFVGDKTSRQIILLFSNNDALNLKERRGQASYPDDMVDMDEFLTYWASASDATTLNPLNKLRERGKGMVLFAPEQTKFEKLSTVLNRVVFYPFAYINSNFEDLIKRFEFGYYGM